MRKREARGAGAWGAGAAVQMPRWTVQGRRSCPCPPCGWAGCLLQGPRGSSCLGVEPSGRHGKGSGEGAERGGSVSRGGPQLPGLTLACLVVMGRQGGCSWTAESRTREVQLSSGAVAIRTPGSWAGDTHGKGAPSLQRVLQVLLGGAVRSQSRLRGRTHLSAQTGPPIPAFVLVSAEVHSGAQ